MIAHHVLFWLKDDISETEYNEFKTALEDLKRTFFSCRNSC